MAERTGSADNAHQSPPAQSLLPISRSSHHQQQQQHPRHPHHRLAPPSPPMPPSYAFSPSRSTGQGVGPYRASPPSSYASSSSSTLLPSISLPPIRSVDAQAPHPIHPAGLPRYPSQPPPPASPMLQQQHQQQHQQQPPPPQYSRPALMPAYYAPPPLTPGPGLRSPALQLGFGAPAQSPNPLCRPTSQVPDHRAVPTGRHKKEIKRRTKTGCLTCRRRRIKCDEAHPACRNCQKSKRECLGYDPIFRPQSSPAQLQPAPHPPSTADASALSPPPSAPQHPSVPQGYAAPGGLAQKQPQVGGHQSGSYDFGSAIDPSLRPDTEGMPHSQTAQESPTDAPGDRRQSAYEGAHPSEGSRTHPAFLEADAAAGRRARIEQLFSVNGHAPPVQHVPPGPLPDASADEIRLIYTRDYAPGLDKVLETDWYSRRSWPRVLQDHRLMALLTQLLQLFKTVRSDDFNGNRLTRSMETKAVWELLSVIREVVSTDAQEVDQLKEARARLDLLEALLTNSVLARNPLSDLRHDHQLSNTKQWQVEFWRLLGQFVMPPQPVATAGDVAPPLQPSTEETLQACRNILAMLENRDVLYSIMICRHYGPTLPDWPDGVRDAYTNDPADTQTNVIIAKRFIEEEAGGKGTNQAIQRICDMAATAWRVTR